MNHKGLVVRRANQLLYLDFDGVLHHENVVIHPKKGIHIAPVESNLKLFEWAPILEKLLAPYPDVRIVLSTSWVQERGFSFAVRQLGKTLGGRVIGATYHRRHMRREEFVLIPRGAQVAGDVCRRLPRAWFALDDDDVGWPQWCRDNLIHTDGEVGLSDPAIQVAVREKLERSAGV